MHTESLGAAIADLKNATAALLKVETDAGGLPDQVLLDALRELRPVVCQVQAAEARLIGAVHLRGAVTAEGGISTAAWLRNGVHMDDSSARVRSAVVLDRLRLVAAAFEAGEISEAHVEAIAKVARDITDEAMAAGAEELLVDEAKGLAPTRFVQAATRIRDHFDPDAADRRRKRRLTERWLHANRTFEGAVSINGMLDPESGETLLTALAALMPPPRAGDLRDTPTRRADALLDLCRLAANASPVAGGEKPHVIVTVDLETLRSQLDQPAAPTTRRAANAAAAMNGSGDAPGTASADGTVNGKAPTEADPDSPASRSLHDTAPGAEPRQRHGASVGPGRSTVGNGASLGPGRPTAGKNVSVGSGWPTVGNGATLGSGWSIAPETARRLACDAGIIPMMLGSGSEPLDVGRLSRTAPPALRRALVYRDGGCRFPQCDRPPEWTDAHHIQHWVLDGPTALRNMVLLCRAHHVMVHEQGWLISLDPITGIVTVWYPGGQPFETSQPRGAAPLRGAPTATTHRKAFTC